MEWLITLGIIVVLIAMIAPAAIRIVQEYERGVMFRLGRYVGVRGPGLILMIPYVERMQKADLRVVTMDVAAQECITRDNVTLRVNAVVYFRVIAPEDSVIKVFDHVRATSQISQTTLRSVLGQSELDELLSQRERLNQQLQQIIDEQTEPWGVKVSLVEIKDVELPDTMKRAMARQAEAERERRAKVIHAEGEFQASARLAEAGAILSVNPANLQLRYLQTLTEIATEKATIMVFPLPIDIISSLMGRLAPPVGSGAPPAAREDAS